MLSLPAVSVNVAPATSTVIVPAELGVNVAVYTNPLPEKSFKVAPETVISLELKPMFGSDIVNLIDKVLIVEFPPLIRSSDSITNEGA